MLMEPKRNFRMAYDVRPVQVKKKLLLIDFFQEENVGLKVVRCSKSNISVLVF